MHVYIKCTVYRFFNNQKARKMGKFLENLGTAAANGLGGGLVGMGLNFIGNLIGKGSQEEAMQKQWELEQKKMALQYEYNQKAADYSQQLGKEMWDYTNYENQMKHIKAAGLNPALLYGQGGAGGASAQGAGRQEGVAMGETGAVAMGLQLKSIQAQNNLANAQAAKAMAEANKINEADIPNAGKDIEYKDSLIKTNESLQSLNSATERFKNAATENLETEKELLTKQILTAAENLKSLIRDNEIGDKTKEEQIEKVKLSVKLAEKELLAKQTGIELSEKQMDWLDTQINGYAYQLVTERIKANAAERGSYAQEANAEANYQQAIAKNAETQAVVYKIKKEVEKWGIQLNIEQERLLKDWIYGGIDAACNVVTAATPLRMGSLVKERHTMYRDKEGKITESWDWSRNRPAIKH